MNRPHRRRSLAAIISALLCLLLAASLAAASDELPSWRDGQTRQNILAFVHAVSTPGDPAFLPPRERVAAFDLDGTLLSEKPHFFVMQAAFARLWRVCPELGQKNPNPKAANLCRAASKRDWEYLYKYIGLTLTLPFEGMEFTRYRNFCAEVFARGHNPVKKRPLHEMLFEPMLELIDLLNRSGFSVWVNSGTDQFALQAIAPHYLHVPEERCVGSEVWGDLKEENGRIVLRRGLEKPPVNLGPGKVIHQFKRAGRRPILAAGNSMGDALLLKWTSENPHASLCLVIDHDDPREFVYSDPKLLKLADERGWQKVSMAADFKRVYPEPVK